MLLEQSVDRRILLNGYERPARVHAIVLPILRPLLRGRDELTGEVPGVRKSLINLQAARQADIHVRFHDGNLRRRQTFLQALPF